MTYKKYVRQIELYDITSEPTENIQSLEQINNDKNADLIIVYVVISFIVIVIIFSIFYLKRYRNIC
jgi:subtilase family serine protease